MIRVLHFSDVHVVEGFSGTPIREFVNKRVIGFANHALRRGVRFEQAPMKLRALTDFMREQSVDLSICTGDYTALGTHRELNFARAQIEPLTQAPLGFVTVPGNHDLYLPDTIRDSRFDQHFGDLLVTDMPELSCDGLWPQVRLFGGHVAVVAVNSARPNPSIIRSSGHIPHEQLMALDRILRDERIRTRFVFVATHYAPRLGNGRPDRPRHGLENANEFLEICKQAERGAIIFGHVHWRYHVRLSGLRMDLCNAGSATHEGREGLWVYEVGPEEAWAIPGKWSQDRYILNRDRRIRLNAKD